MKTREQAIDIHNQSLKNISNKLDKWHPLESHSIKKNCLNIFVGMGSQIGFSWPSTSQLFFGFSVKNKDRKPINSISIFHKFLYNQQNNL